MKPGAGIFWLLVVLLFGGAAYFGVHVARMKEAAARGHDHVAEGATEAPAAGEPGEGAAEGQGAGR